MHVVLGILGSIVSILYMLDRLGIDLGGLNPFYWRRRRAWAKRYHGDPIYSVEDPMEVAAILIVGSAKLDGDLSAEQKKVALQQFQSAFSLQASEASDLFGSAAHLLGSPQVIDSQLKGVADKNQKRFSREQAKSVLHVMATVAAADGDLNAKQIEYIEGIRSQIMQPEEEQGTWS